MSYNSARILKFIGIFLFAVVMTTGCATKRKKGETSKVGLFFHNLNSKYNGYFNADELMKKSLITLEENNEDNYYQLLSVYPYSDPSGAKSISPDMDIAIEKVTTVATLHEPSHWVDDCYVLMGKAQFLKQDYETAEETLEYFQEEFDPGNPFGRTYDKNKGKKSSKEIKKRREAEKKEAKKLKENERKEKEEARDKEKKEREKAAKERKKGKKRGSRKKQRAPKEETAKDSTITTIPTSTKKISSNQDTENKKDDNKSTEKIAKKISRYPKGDAGLFGHSPSYYEGVLWLSKTYMEREKYAYAEYLLNKLENEYPSSKEVVIEIPAAKAHLSIKQKKYNEAIPHLESAIEADKNKRHKARYAFIIAQIYQMQNQSSQALEAYKRVKKFKPSYEMEFNTTLNTAILNNATSNQSSESFANEIEGLLKEAKYNDFHDQIYFALGEIRFKNNDTPGAITAFEQSIEASTGNSIQQTETYYRLASLLYQSGDYVAAKNNYDNTLKVMDKKDPRVPEVTKYANSLTDIAANIELIKLQDSLMNIALMDKDDRLALAKQLWEEQKDNPDSELNVKSKEDIRKEKFEGIKRSGMRGTSSFFAYNTAAKIKGQQSFNRKWGDRNLEDNWRRSDKFSTADLENTDEEDKDDEAEPEEELSDAMIKRIFKDVPFDINDQIKSNKEVKDALFALGVDFRDAIQNYDASVKTHGSLEDRFPKSNHELDAFYYQYLSYTDLSNNPKAIEYKNKIIEGYPESNYAKILLDPSYANELMKDEQNLVDYYNETYNLFEQHQYTTVNERLSQTNTLFGDDNDLRAKFSLLQAMVTGNIEGKEAYISALREVSTRHANTPEDTRAKEIMRFLRGDSNAFDKALYSEAQELFKLDDNKLHYIVAVIYESNEAKKRDAKVAISTYNKKYHKLDKLRITDIYLNAQDKTQIILVRKFKNRKEAMQYYDQVMISKDEYIDDSVSYDLFAVTQKNYREIIKQKNVKNYGLFFDQNYIKNEPKGK